MFTSMPKRACQEPCSKDAVAGPCRRVIPSASNLSAGDLHGGRVLVRGLKCSLFFRNDSFGRVAFFLAFCGLTTAKKNAQLPQRSRGWSVVSSLSLVAGNAGRIKHGMRYYFFRRFRRSAQLSSCRSCLEKMRRVLAHAFGAVTLEAAKDQTVSRLCLETLRAWGW